MSLGIVTRSTRRGRPGAATTIDGRPMIQQQGNVWYVDANVGGSGSGKSLQSAFSTMEEAFDSLASGDTIYTRGKIREQLVTPVQVFDVSVIGLGNRPRHADSTPDGGQEAANTWAAPASPVAAQALVRVLQQGWLFENILFAASAGCACIELVRDAGSGNDERDASHVTILRNRFAGVASTDSAVKFGATSYSEIVNNARIEGNDFQGLAHAIKDNSANLSFRPQIVDNVFQANTNDVVLRAYQARILGNVMSLAPTAALVLSGGVGSSQVHGNYLPGTYADGALYAPGTSDNWNGNYASTGVTAAVPS